MLSDWISKKKLPDVRALIRDVPVPPAIEQALSSRFPTVKRPYNAPWSGEEHTLVHSVPLDWYIEFIPKATFIWAPVDLTNTDTWNTLFATANFLGFCPMEGLPVPFAIVVLGMSGPRHICFSDVSSMSTELANYLTQVKEFTSLWR